MVLIFLWWYTLQCSAYQRVSCDNSVAHTGYIDTTYGAPPYTVASHLCFAYRSEDIILKQFFCKKSELRGYWRMCFGLWTCFVRIHDSKQGKRSTMFSLDILPQMLKLLLLTGANEVSQEWQTPASKPERGTHCTRNPLRKNHFYVATNAPDLRA